MNVRSSMMAKLLLAGVCLVVAGCSSAPIAPTYTQAELKGICDRNGGWWHGNDLVGGFCEYHGPQP